MVTAGGVTVQDLNPGFLTWETHFGRNMGSISDTFGQLNGTGSSSSMPSWHLLSSHLSKEATLRWEVKLRAFTA